MTMSNYQPVSRRRALVPYNSTQKPQKRNSEDVAVSIIKLLITLAIIGFIAWNLPIPKGLPSLKEEQHHTLFPKGLPSLKEEQRTPSEVVELQEDTFTLRQVEVLCGKHKVVPKRKFAYNDPKLFATISTMSHEGYREKSYDDNKSFSIGFGFNLHPNNRKLFKQLFNRDICLNGNCAEASISRYEALYLVCYLVGNTYDHYLNRYEQDECMALAAAMRAYNRGNTGHEKHFIGACCGATSGCGSKDTRIRAAHNQRRLEEVLTIYNDKAQLKATYKKHKEKIQRLGFSEDEVAQCLRKLSKTL